MKDALCILRYSSNEPTLPCDAYPGRSKALRKRQAFKVFNVLFQFSLFRGRFISKSCFSVCQIVKKKRAKNHFVSIQKREKKNQNAAILKEMGASWKIGTWGIPCRKDAGQLLEPMNIGTLNPTNPEEDERSERIWQRANSLFLFIVSAKHPSRGAVSGVADGRVGVS